MNNELIYDVGAHEGQDTIRFLNAGYHVIAIEAAPVLANRLRGRFAAAIEQGQLHVLNIAITDHDGEESFYISDNSLWNSFNEEMATRKGNRAKKVTVPCRTYPSIVQEYGRPVYLKVDIEGADRHCILGIERTHRPDYVSYEAGPDITELADHLARVGYTQFRIVDQYGWHEMTVPLPGTAAHITWSVRQYLRIRLRGMSRLHSRLQAVKKKMHAIRSKHDGSSGPLPFEQAAHWLSIDDLRYTWRNLQHSGLAETSWYDIHAYGTWEKEAKGRGQNVNK